MGLPAAQRKQTAQLREWFVNRFLIVTALVFLVFPGLASACGVNSRCLLGDRHYYIALPEGHTNGDLSPALVFAHGYQGSGLGIIRNKGLRKLASDLGVALIAVKSKGASWSLPNSPRASRAMDANELRYFDAVKEDAVARFGLDSDRFVMTGASTGGMMAWTLACERSASFAAFIPMSGTFWAPIPATCGGPTANIVHFHGTKDRTVPLEGRPVRETHQGSVYEALEMYHDYGKFKEAKQKVFGGLNCKISMNRKGNILNFCLYDGGHSFRTENIRQAWMMLQAAGQLK